MTSDHGEPADPGTVDNVVEPVHRVVNHFLHDFLGGLTSVIMQIQAVRDGTFGEVKAGQDGRLGRAIDDCLRMVALIRDYRDATQMLEGTYRPEPEVLDLHSLVESLRAELWDVAGRRKLVPSLTVRGELPKVRIAATLVRRLIARLVQLLATCTRPGGGLVVEIEVVPTDGPARLRVEASAEGVQFAPQDLESVFDELHQATRGVQIGRGYGMVFCRAAARCVDGELSLRPLPGHGTRVDLVLPMERVER